MEQTVTNVPGVQVMHIICHTLAAHVDLEPTLCELVHFPLKVKDFLVGKIISVQKQKHRQAKASPRDEALSLLSKVRVPLLLECLHQPTNPSC
jgi:hypothetical protein